MLALAFIFIIVFLFYWNRHAVDPSDNFFLHTCHFFIFIKILQEIKIDYVQYPISSGDHHQGRLDRTMWESLRIEIPGECCTSLPMVKPG